MAPSSDVLIRMKTIGADMVARDAKKASGALERAQRSSTKAGRSAEQSGEQVRRSSRRWQTFTGGMDKFTRAGSRVQGTLHGVTGGLLGLAAGFASIRGAKAAIGTVEDLAKASLALQRNAGFDTETANRWASLLQSRGIAVKTFTTSIIGIGRNTLAANRQIDAFRTRLAALREQQRQLAGETAKTTKEAEALARKRAKVEAQITALMRKGAGQQAAALKQLGLTQADLRGDTETVLRKIADGFKRLPDGANRAAIAQKILGKAGVQLLPILNLGSEGIDEQIALLEKYGAVIAGKTPKQVAEIIKAQREWKVAQLGLSVSLGQTLLPVVTKATQILPVIANDIREGNGAWSVLTNTLRGAGAVLKTVTGFLSENETAGKVVLGVVVALTAATLAYKAGMLVATFATNAMTVAQKALDLVMKHSTIGMVVTALGLLAAAFVYAYRNSAAFRAGVHAVIGVLNQAWNVLRTVFEWVRGNWQKLAIILGGPIGIAAVLIARHFGRIRRAAGAVVGFVMGKWQGFIGFFTGLPGKVAAAAGAIASAVGDAVRGIVESIVSNLPGPVRRFLGLEPGSTVQDFQFGGTPTSIQDNPLLNTRATGGIVGPRESRTGTIVGERGAELARFPAGTRIFPANRTRPMLAAAGGGGEIVVPVTLMLDGEVLHRSVVRAERRQMERR